MGQLRERDRSLGSVPEGFLEVLKCPDCDGTILKGRNALVCRGCGREFGITDDGIIQMLPLKAKPRPAIYDDPNYVRWQQYSSEALEEYFESDNRVFRLIHDSAHERISEWMRECSSSGWIVDIGCGAGYHYQYHEKLEDVIGIDTNMDSLHKIKDRYPDAMLIEADCCCIPLKDGVVANALSIYALEHIYYLKEAILEAYRTLSADGKYLVGLPCEGGLAWNLGRKLTSQRTLSRRYGVDYRKVIAIEHCNTAKEVLACLSKFFKIERYEYFPLKLLPFTLLNLTLALQLSKKR